MIEPGPCVDCRHWRRDEVPFHLWPGRLHRTTPANRLYGLRDVASGHRGGGYHAERVLKGESDIAVQAEHEIRCVPGVEFVPYPAEFQRTVSFTAGRFFFIWIGVK